MPQFEIRSLFKFSSLDIVHADLELDNQAHARSANPTIPVKELCRRIGISDATFYHWKAKYGGLEVNEARRLRQLEDENGRLKKIVAQQALDIDALKVVLSKKW